MLLPAKTLLQIRENCHPGPLRTDGELDAFYVDTTAARSNFRKLIPELETRLRDPDMARILVYGHGGCGKSTEFNYMCRDLGPEWFPVRVEAVKMLQPYGVEPEDILLAIACTLIKTAETSGLEPTGAEEALSEVEAFFSEITVTGTTQKSADVSGAAGVDTKKSWFGTLFGFSAKLEGELKYGRRSEKTTIHKVRQHPSEVVSSLNAIISAVQHALGEERKLLIIVEDLDKLNLRDADRVFGKNSRLLADVRAHIIYTIPIFTLHCAESASIRAAFPFIRGLPMPKVIARDGSIGPGYAVLKEIILRRVAPEAITADALDLVIRRSGGVLRDAFEALVTAASYDRASVPLSIEFVRQALLEMGNARAVAIAYPPADPDKSFKRDDPGPLFKRLQEVAELQAQHKRVAPSSSPNDQVLLASGSLVEYNDEAWLGVHPLIWSWMDDQRYEMPKDPYGP